MQELFAGLPPPEESWYTSPTTKGKLAYITPPEESKYVNHHHRKISTHTTTREKLDWTGTELETGTELGNSTVF